jgi:hypothetical protein
LGQYAIAATAAAAVRHAELQAVAFRVGPKASALLITVPDFCFCFCFSYHFHFPSTWGGTKLIKVLIFPLVLPMALLLLATLCIAYYMPFVAFAVFHHTACDNRTGSWVETMTKHNVTVLDYHDNFEWPKMR